MVFSKKPDSHLFFSRKPLPCARSLGRDRATTPLLKVKDRSKSC